MNKLLEWVVMGVKDLWRWLACAQNERLTRQLQEDEAYIHEHQAI